MKEVYNSQVSDVHPDKFVIAYLSNTKQSLEGTLSVDFDIVKVSYSVFKELFYHSCAQNFHIDLSNTNNPLLILKNYTTNCNKFVLYDYLMKAWEEANNTSRNKIPADKQVLVNRKCWRTKSLTDICPVQTALNKNEIMDRLIGDDIIIPFPHASADVNLTINVLYYSDILDVSLSININLLVNIPGFKLVYNACKEKKPCHHPYSKEELIKFITDDCPYSREEIHCNESISDESSSDSGSCEHSFEIDTCVSEDIFNTKSKINKLISDDHTQISDWN
jgi:hypothetical protein